MFLLCPIFWLPRKQHNILRFGHFIDRKRQGDLPHSSRLTNMIVNHEANIKRSLNYSNIKKKTYLHKTNYEQKVVHLHKPCTTTANWGKASHIANLGTRQQWKICFMLWQLYYLLCTISNGLRLLQPTVGAAIQACYTEEKLIESMRTKSLSKLHTISKTIRLWAIQLANQGLIPLHDPLMQQSTPPASPWFLRLWYAYHYWYTKQC